MPEKNPETFESPNYKNADLSNFEIREVVKTNEETGEEIRTNYIVH